MVDEPPTLGKDTLTLVSGARCSPSLVVTSGACIRLFGQFDVTTTLGRTTCGAFASRKACCRCNYVALSRSLRPERPLLSHLYDSSRLRGSPLTSRKYSRPNHIFRWLSRRQKMIRHCANSSSHRTAFSVKCLFGSLVPLERPKTTEASCAVHYRPRRRRVLPHVVLGGEVAG